MSNTLSGYQAQLIEAIKAGDHLTATHVERQILGHPELERLVMENARSKRKTITSIDGYDPDHVPGALKRVKVNSKKKNRIAWSPKDPDYVQGLYYLRGTIIPIANQVAGKTNTHAYMPGRSTTTAIDELLLAESRMGNATALIIQCDVAECFPSIPTRLSQLYLPNATWRYIEQVQARYQMVDMAATGMPQGHPCSPAIVVIALTTILGKAITKHPESKVIVYADDITIIGPDKDALDTETDIKYHLSQWGMLLKPSKRRVSRLVIGTSINVLGYQISNNGSRPLMISPSPQAYHNLQEKLAGSLSLKEAEAIQKGWASAYQLTNDPAHQAKTKRAVTAGLEASAGLSDTVAGRSRDWPL